MADNSKLRNIKWASENISSKFQTGETVSSEATMLLVGPPRLDQVKDIITNIFTETTADENTSPETLGGTAGYELLPLGRSLMFDFRQTKPNQVFHEIGSRRAYVLSEKPVYSGDLRSIELYDKNLLYTLYSQKYLQPADPYANDINWRDFLRDDKPGFHPSFQALSSRLFTSHIGICVLEITNRDNPYNGLYLEDVLLNSYLKSINSGQSTMMEITSFDCGYVRPVDIVGSTALSNNITE